MGSTSVVSGDCQIIDNPRECGAYNKIAVNAWQGSRTSNLIEFTLATLCYLSRRQRTVSHEVVYCT